MPTRLTSREVLAYLNYLGYNNVNAQQLKEFVHDLKKLIKYEERKKAQNNDVGIDLEEPTDIFSNLHLQATCASRAKVVPKKESVISLQIKKSKCQLHCTKHGKENQNEEVAPEGDKCEDIEKVPVSLSDPGISKKSSGANLNKPKSSFIRPTIRTINKGDPVALYHHYKAGWKRQKVPGEDHRSELRWAIRQKMSRASSLSRA